MSSYKGPTGDDPSIDSEYAIKRTEVILNEIPEKDKMSWQSHHDHYVKAYIDATKNGVSLDEIEMGEYQLAMNREQAGLVKPLKLKEN